MPAFVPLLNKGIGEQVLNRRLNRQPLQCLQLLARVLDIGHQWVFRAQNIHPTAHETGRVIQLWRIARAHIQTALYTATFRMAHDDQMRDPQNRNRIFHSRRSAMMGAVGLIRRHQTGNIAMHEKLTLIPLKQRDIRHPTVTTGDHHGTRALPLGCQPLIPSLVLSVSCRTPTLVSLLQKCWQRL